MRQGISTPKKYGYLHDYRINGADIAQVVLHSGPRIDSIFPLSPETRNGGSV
jgi:hypothetical protein